MKAARLTAFGVPREVVQCADVADVGEPAFGEVVIEVEACSINPADLLIIEGRYPSDIRPPAPLGIEGAGRVVAIGGGVGDVAVGDKVMSLDRANWVQKLKLKAEQVIKLPEGVDILQAGMLKANPASAQLMLRDYVDLAPGDWVIQNAANSGVGVNLIRLARARGIRTVNVVRRESLIQPLKAIGADVVLVDGDDLAERVRAETGGASIPLAIDAVAGPATLRLADCLADGGTVVNFGMLSGQPCQISPAQIFFRSITLTGFWLAKMMRSMPTSEIRALYTDLAGRLADGTLGVEIEATYTLDRISEAMEHAGREGRSGKILLTPNEPIRTETGSA
jgi:NADPH:quinone reductase-like Zn-dependent oxidoreductase